MDMAKMVPFLHMIWTVEEYNMRINYFFLL